MSLLRLGHGILTKTPGAGVAPFLGDHSEAEGLCSESLRVFVYVCDPRSRAYALSNLGVVTLALGRPSEARDLFLPALALDRKHADRWLVATGPLHISDVFVLENKLTEVRHLARNAPRLAVSQRI